MTACRLKFGGRRRREGGPPGGATGQLDRECPPSPQYGQSPRVRRRVFSFSVKCQNPLASSSMGVVPSAVCEGTRRAPEGEADVLGAGVVEGTGAGAGAAEGVDQAKGRDAGF